MHSYRLIGRVASKASVQNVIFDKHNSRIIHQNKRLAAFVCVCGGGGGRGIALSQVITPTSQYDHHDLERHTTQPPAINGDQSCVRLKAAVHWVRAKIAPNRLIADFNISDYGVAR